jgi:hypothetical protein
MEEWSSYVVMQVGVGDGDELGGVSHIKKTVIEVLAAVHV